MNDQYHYLGGPILADFNPKYLFWEERRELRRLFHMGPYGLSEVQVRDYPAVDFKIQFRQ